MTKDEMLNWLSKQAHVGHVVRLVQERKFSSEELDQMQRQMQPHVKMKAEFKKARGA